LLDVGEVQVAATHPASRMTTTVPREMANLPLLSATVNTRTGGTVVVGPGTDVVVVISVTGKVVTGATTDVGVVVATVSGGRLLLT
jgi:hypothetical protein